MLQLFDTAKGGVVPFEPREPGKVSMYVCGPTVYGPPHIGHGRFSLVFDVLRRYLRWEGNDVTYISNVTDIDDKIIERAQREDRDWRDIADRCETVWYRAMDALGVERPDDDPHATAYVERMVELIERLVDQGVAYETTDGVYFQSERVEDYGLLARQPLDSLKAGARVEGIDEKRSPVDFVLWKKAKPGEPTWPSPWGEGRPGWHTECVVMSLDLLGERFDIHGGGQDLAFPHHENERAQAVADGRQFARHWLHNGFVEVEGTKMSKSLGNVSNLLDLVDQYDARAYRLLVLQSHYRSPIDVTDSTLRDAERSLDRLDAFARRAAGHGGRLRPRPPRQRTARRRRRGGYWSAGRRRARDHRRARARAAHRGRRGAGRHARARPPARRGPGRQGLVLRRQAARPDRRRRIRGRGHPDRHGRPPP